MGKGILSKLVAIACVFAIAGILAGCASGAATSATEEEQANRAYMSRVNESMIKLDGELDGFIDAVKRGDIVNMRSQADNAYKVLDELEAIEAPDALSDVQKDYVGGSAKLREALDEYIDLYAEITAKGDGFDWTAYEKRIADIQKTYDEGVALMKSADQAMSGIVTDESSGSASSAESASGEASDSASSEPAESEASSDSSDASSASA